MFRPSRKCAGNAEQRLYQAKQHRKGKAGGLGKCLSRNKWLVTLADLRIGDRSGQVASLFVVFPLEDPQTLLASLLLIWP
jgi:hypothetical protein